MSSELHIAKYHAIGFYFQAQSFIKRQTVNHQEVDDAFPDVTSVVLKSNSLEITYNKGKYNVYYQVEPNSFIITFEQCVNE